MKLSITILAILLISRSIWFETSATAEEADSLWMTNIDSGLISSYYFDGDAMDESGIHNGTIHGASQTSDRFGRLESAMEFDGVNDYISLGMDFLNFDSMTVSLWIFISSESDSVTGDRYFICSGNPGVTTGIYGIWNDALVSCGQSTAGSITLDSLHSELVQNHWYNVTMVFDTIEKNASTYINGELKYSSTYLDSTISESTDSVFLGKSTFSSVNGFQGKIDDLKVYNRALSPSEIQALYSEDCQDSIDLVNAEFYRDTALFAKSWISMDDIILDTGIQLYLHAPEVFIDTAKVPLFSELTIQPADGCDQSDASYENHFRHRGIYINNFVTDSILGNAEKEDSILNWCMHNDFNNIYLYNIGTALSSGMDEGLDSFVHKAHDMTKPILVTFVSSGFGTSFSNIEFYHDDYDNVPTGIVSEIEFWNGDGTYADDFEPWVERMNELKTDTVEGTVRNPELKRRFYIGKIKNAGEPVSLEIAEDLVANHDEIFLTNYHTDAFMLSNSASENSIRNKLALLGEAGHNLGKKVNLVILFNVRQDSPAPNIWSYFDETDCDNTFSRAYTTFYLDFLSAEDIDNKEYLNLLGYGIYRHSDAIEARDEED